MQGPINVLRPIFNKDRAIELIGECLEGGWTGMGNKTYEFEKAWSDYTNLPHSHFLSSNTVGLHLALEIPKRALGWDQESQVITTPITFVSTNHSILQAGLTPVFADVDSSLCLDPQSVRERITQNTRAVIYVGIGGNTQNLDEIEDICRENNLFLVLDAAHMAGSRIDRRHVGHGIDVTVFSFQAVKNLPTADSGMICFKSEEYDKYARKLSWLGIDKDTFQRSSNKGSYKWEYDIDELGYKYHGNSIMAAIALAQLEALDKDNSYRRSIYDRYHNNLSGRLNVKLIAHANPSESSRHLIQCVVPNRDEVLLALHEYQIYPGVHYKDNTEFKPYKQWHGSCPNAHSLSHKIISLPCHLGLNFNEVDFVSESLVKTVERWS